MVSRSQPPIVIITSSAPAISEAGANTSDPGNVNVRIFWLYLGNREDCGPSLGAPTLVSPNRLGTAYAPSSQTLAACLAYEVPIGTVGFNLNSQAPHVARQSRLTVYTTSPFVALPEALGVGYLDFSARFVPFRELTKLRESHPSSGGQLYGNIFYDNR